MRPKREPSARVILFGLPADIAESLEQIASEWGSIVHIPPHFPAQQSFRLIQEVAPDLVFVWTGANPGASLLEVAKSAQPHVPAVAVSRRVENSAILDALDSGAMDYCTPPFDMLHIRRLLESANQAACTC